MNKGELVDRVADECGVSKKIAKLALEATVEVIKQEVAEGEKVSLHGFGTFERRDRASRKGRNPKTGEDIEIPASKAPAFKPGKEFKTIVNQ